MKLRSIGKKGNVVAGVQVMIVVGVFLALGIYVLAQIFAAIPTLTAGSAAANASSLVQTNTWAAMQLFAIVMIVLAAAIILSVVVGSLGGSPD
jgi:type III secretory pathway component EscU